MIVIKIVCDRCKWEVKDAGSNPLGGPFTAGFYVTTVPGYWSQFANVGEHHVCDSCMFVDPRYLKVYGVMQSAPHEVIG